MQRNYSEPKRKGLSHFPLGRYGVVLFFILIAKNLVWTMGATMPPLLIPLARTMASQLSEQHFFVLPSSENLFGQESQEQRATKNIISAYDHLFIKEASRIGWNWWYLAAIAYHESKFQPHVGGTRKASAIGLMGILPSTGKRFGATRAQLKDPAISVRVAASCLNAFAQEFPNAATLRDRELFALASYACGSAHIHDACRIANKYGANPNVWEEVKPFILKMNQPKYYRDPLVRWGKFNGKHTVTCTDDMDALAQKYAEKIKQAEYANR